VKPRTSALALTLALAACGGRGAAPKASPNPSEATPPPARGPEADAARIAHDNEVVKEAQAIANPVLASATDCAALKAGLHDAQATLENAYERAYTEAGREAVANLKKQLEDAAKACP
jgi:hypothetical protein